MSRKGEKGEILKPGFLSSGPSCNFFNFDCCFLKLLISPDTANIGSGFLIRVAKQRESWKNFFKFFAISINKFLYLTLKNFYFKAGHVILHLKNLQLWDFLKNSKNLH